MAEYRSKYYALNASLKKQNIIIEGALKIRMLNNLGPAFKTYPTVVNRAEWERMNHGNSKDFRPPGHPPPPTAALTDGLVLPARLPHQQLLKPKVPDTYRGQNHAECYKFCKQLQEYFDTQGIPTSNPHCIPFAATF